MADILIRGMEMPKDGTYSIVHIYSDGHISMPFWGKGMQIVSGITAVPLPKGHGRIVDAAEILEKAKNSPWFDGDVSELGLLLGSEVTTIVPAEGGKADG